MGTKREPKPRTVTVRVWVDGEAVEFEVRGPLSVYGKQTKGSK